MTDLPPPPPGATPVAPYAKTVAAFLVPIFAALLAAVAERAGIEIPYDPSTLETVVTALVTAVGVWYVRNRPAP